MSELLRAGLRGATILVIGMTAWLAIVIVGVLPQRDPASIGLWAGVAVASGALALAALRATMRLDRPGPSLGVALAALSIAALVFGGFVLLSLAVPGERGAHFEGYLLLIGLILGLEGALGLGWLLAARRS